MEEKQDKFVSSAEAVAILKVVPLTLHNWEKAGKIDTMKTGGGHRRYNVDKYLRENVNSKEKESAKPLKTINSNESINSIDTMSSLSSESFQELVKKNNGDLKTNKKENLKETKSKKKNSEKENICYVRCTSIENKAFLNAEKAYLEKKYPNHKIIEDIGYSTSFLGTGLTEIVELAMQGKINNLVITDNINMSSYELEILQHMIKTVSNGSIFIDKGQNDNNLKNNLIDDVVHNLEACIKKLAELKSKN